jgi:protein-S-isoprenylcysteine O-methyltransferase Ste14
MNELTARLLLAGLFVAFFMVRAYNHRRAIQQGGKIEYKEPHSLIMRIIRSVGGIAIVAGLACFFFIPEWVAWASIPFPAWVRWVGFAIGALSVVAVWWTEFSLGLNFNATLHHREGHTLVTHGPYRWARHPMYTSLFLMTVSWLLLSANWLIGLPGLIGLLTIVVNRVRAEEQLMINTFGDQYREYMTRTGRFLPKFG